MESHIVKILSIEDVTHNVKRFIVEKPMGYVFIPGQATDVAINKPGLENELRPFTFTSLNDWNYLEFTIKIYKGHDGVTEKLGSLSIGDELIVHEVFGTIQYKGIGIFIAGGAGITPFLSIFRQLNQTGDLQGNTLLFANHNEDDIICRTELSYLLGENLVNVLKEPHDPGIKSEVINEELLLGFSGSNINYWYICGPDAFTNAMVGHLEHIGIKKEQIVIEQ
ncbi:FAD-binding oxidoreductase [Pedobacter sp. ASV1-7]|uniref:FAD-binding oxidoreductase n=1 Tax=Pedobacter sp. ASV1-7 TaxID=3145237 RepID=UPI0032E8C564